MVWRDREVAGRDTANRNSWASLMHEPTGTQREKRMAEQVVR